MRGPAVALTVLTLMLAVSTPPGNAGFILRGSGGSGAGCSEPSPADIISETWLGSTEVSVTGGEGSGAEGYADETWTGVEGTNGTMDADYALSGSPPDSSCLEGLLTAVTAGGTETYLVRNYGSQLSGTVDFYFEFYVDSYTLPVNDDQYTFIDARGSEFSGTIFTVRLDNDYGELDLRVYSSSGNVTFNSISVDTWYTLHFHHNDSRANSYVQLDGGSQQAITSYDNTFQYLRIGPNGASFDADEAGAIQWGRVWVDTP